MQRDALRGHQAAGAVFGVFQDLVDLFPGLAVRLQQDALDDVCRHLFDEVYRIVYEQLVQHQLEFFIGKGRDQKLLLGAAHLHERLRRQFFGEKAEDDGNVFVVQFRKDLRKVGRLQFGEQGLEQGELLFFR